MRRSNALRPRAARNEGASQNGIMCRDQQLPPDKCVGRGDAAARLAKDFGMASYEIWFI